MPHIATGSATTVLIILMIVTVSTGSIINEGTLAIIFGSTALALVPPLSWTHWRHNKRQTIMREKSRGRKRRNNELTYRSS